MIEGGFHSAKGHEIVCSEDGCWSHRKCQERFGSLVTALHSGIAVLHILRGQCDAECCQRRAESLQPERVAWRLNNHGRALGAPLQKMPDCPPTRRAEIECANTPGH